MTISETAQPSRLMGLDLARYFALVGMVIVNFNVVMAGPDRETGGLLVELLQGRAAASFVVLAGIGFGLSASRSSGDSVLTTTVRRAAFLLVVGMINMLIFPADIIHYYAFYFLIALMFLRASGGKLLAAIAILTLCFPLLVLVFDYDAGWQWDTADYVGIWTINGFVRNLLFNGWHPVIPWLAFFLWGMVLSRARLQERRVQLALIGLGVVVYAGSMLLSHWLQVAVKTDDPELHYMFATAPIPPAPLFVIAGGSVASAAIGLCLLLAPRFQSAGILALLSPAGRHTLTLYLAHIIIGMGILEATGMIGGQPATTALATAILFCMAATVFSYIWASRFKRGPLEGLMRLVAG